MRHTRFFAALAVGLLVLASRSDPQETRGPSKANLIREERTVMVDGVQETWRLVWRKAPRSVCGPDDAGSWFSCPCIGFAFGEGGILDLIRLGSGKKVDVLPLSPFFHRGESPGEPGEAVVARWPANLDEDLSDQTSPTFSSRVRARSPVPILQMANFDHDGSAWEFFLQTETLPCGKIFGVVIGVSESNRRLHVVGSANHAKRPLVLQKEQWIALRDSANGKVDALDWACGDHGGEEESRVNLQITRQGIRGSMRIYSCREDGKRGKLLREEPL